MRIIFYPEQCCATFKNKCNIWGYLLVWITIPYLWIMAFIAIFTDEILAHVLEKGVTKHNMWCNL